MRVYFVYTMVQKSQKWSKTQIKGGSCRYRGFHFFYAKLWTVAYKKPMEKRYGKIWKIMWWSALLPKIKTRWPSLRDPGNTHHPHFLRTLGGISRHVCPVTAGRNDNLARQRPQTANSIICSRLARSTATVASIERTLNSMRDHRLRDHVRESCGQGERRRLMYLTRSGLCSGVASLVKMVKERHLQFFWPLLFDFFLKRKIS